jgi:hypothetical protein
MEATLVALLGWLFFGAPAADLLDGAAGARWVECVVPAGPAVDAARLPDGGWVVAREGAVEVHGRVLTPCEGLPGAYPTAVVAGEGWIAVGFRAEGAFWLRDGSFVPVEGLPRGVSVRVMAADGARLFIGTSEAGLWQVDEGAAARRVRHPVLGKREVTALLARPEGVEVGAGAWGHWRIEPDGRVRKVARAAFVGCFRSLSPLRSATAAGGRLPAETAGRGETVEARAPGPGCAVDAPAGPDAGLPSGHVTAMAAHRGALYVGTFDGGLARLEGRRFVPVEGAPRFVNVLLSDGDALWIGTAKGLARLGADGRVTRPSLGLPGEHVNSLAAGPDGTLWVATGKGLFGLRGGRVRLVDERAGLPARIVHSVAVTADGAVWAGTAGGVARLGPDGVRTYTQAAGSLPHDWVTSLLPDGNAVIAGTYDAGLARLEADGRAEALTDAGAIWVNPNGVFRVGDALAVTTLGDGLVVRRGGRVVTHRAGLPSDDVTAIAVFEGAVWIGTRGGLVRWSAAPSET